MSPTVMYQTIGAAIAALTALIGIASALVFAGVAPAFTWHVVAVIAGTGIAAIACAMAIAAGVIHRLRLPSDNGEWSYW